MPQRLTTNSFFAKLTFWLLASMDSAVSLLTNPALGPVAKIPELKVCAARIDRLKEK
jgi:hypothetical protein